MNEVSLGYIAAADKYQRLKPLLKQDWAMMLDSGIGDSRLDKKSTKRGTEQNSTEQNGSGQTKQNNQKADSFRRYDICVSQPSVRLSFNGSKTIISKPNNQQKTEISSRPPLQLMRDILAEYAKLSVNEEQLKGEKYSLPFNGGWLGYIGYDFAPSQKLMNTKKSNDTHKTGLSDKTGVSTIPLIRMGLYQWALVTDHQKRTSTLYNFGLCSKQWLDLVKEFEPLLNNKQTTNTSSEEKPFALTETFKSNLSYQEYADAFAKIHDYIRAGDCYQVNFAQKFSAKFSGSALDVYSMLSESNNSPFSAYLNFTDQQILSLSPERFIESHQGRVTTQPIKGTLPRDVNAVKDKQLANQLINSEKDKAENLMIVDLLRNDLSKTAKTASVKVTELFGLYQFESVHHLISTIQSKLAEGFDNFDILATTLPGGSITGAPKIRAMQIIDELEKEKRGIYCGVIGFIDFKGNMDTNICIRTLLATSNQLTCWAGGGLVADSNLEAEYQETFDKLGKILPVLNSTLRENPRVNS